MQGLQQITYTQLVRLQQAGEEFQLIDVREDWERHRFHIGGQHWPMGEIFDHVSLISRQKPVVIYCEKGVRSALVIQRLQVKYGFENLLNLDRGIQSLKSSPDIQVFT